MLSKGFNKFYAQTAVFLVSAFFHEVNSHKTLFISTNLIIQPHNG